MIVFTGDNVEYNNKDAKRYDGVYYAVILNSVKSSNGLDYLCYVYVPEIYGDVDNSKGRLYYRCYDYIRVLVPENTDDCDISDEDREKNKPSVGKIIKVSFDDGNINSCRYLMTIPIDDIYEKMNANYVKEGILPTDVITNITDEKILETLRPLIEVGYYITTGHKGTKNDPVPADCYKYKFLWSNVNRKSNDLSTFRNWFIEALTMPLSSYGAKDVGQYSFNYFPYFSTNIYNLLYVLRDVVDNGDNKKLAELYYKMPVKQNVTVNVNMIDFSLGSEATIKTELTEDKDKAKITSLWLLGLFTGNETVGSSNSTISGDIALAHIAYPELVAEQLHPGLIDSSALKTASLDNSAERLWKFVCYSPAYKYDEDIKKLEAYRFHKLLSDSSIKAAYETHYVSVLATWVSGMNTIDALKNDINFRNVVLMCLTIAPWFASPLLLYTTQDKDIILAMQQFMKAMDKDTYIPYIYRNFEENDTGNIEYSSIFPNQDAYLKFGVSMQTIIKSGDKTTFIDKFKGYVKKYMGKAYNSNAEVFDADACAYKQIDIKFKRLSDIAKIEGWLN